MTFSLAQILQAAARCGVQRVVRILSFPLLSAPRLVRSETGFGALTSGSMRPGGHRLHGCHPRASRRTFRRRKAPTEIMESSRTDLFGTCEER
eukprot:840867-Rhodomonas_salina.2